MTPRIGVITFPGTLDDVDASRAVRVAGAQPVSLWHADADLHGVDAVVIPGGFSYGDYLRAGAIAAQAPVMRSVIDAAHGGMPVLGICNGFQVLCESGLLPGVLMRNAGLRFHCADLPLSVVRTDTVWTSKYDDTATIVIPAKHAEGRYVADEATLDALEAENRILFRYADGSNPNGALRDIAGICSPDGRVAGLMPHPEHAIDTLTGPDSTGRGASTGTDGLPLFTSLITSLLGAAA